MSQPRTASVRVSERTFVATGWKVADLARAAGLKPIYSAPSRGYLMDVARLPDLMAYAELNGVQLIVSGGDAA